MRLFKPLTKFFLCAVILWGCNETKKPLTAEEVKNFARELETSVNRKNPAFFDNALDRKEILRRAGISDQRSTESMNLGTGIVSLLSQKGSFKLIKQYEESGTWHLLFRLYINKIMALNYYDLELWQRGSQIKIAAGYAYNVGQKFSEILKDLDQQMDEVADKAKENKDKWLDQISVMRKLVMKGQFDEAYKTFEGIPADVPQIKLM